MITLITDKDIQDLYSLIQKIDERTKRQTEQIKELQRQIKEILEK